MRLFIWPFSLGLLPGLDSWDKGVRVLGACEEEEELGTGGRQLLSLTQGLTPSPGWLWFPRQQPPGSPSGGVRGEG